MKTEAQKKTPEQIRREEFLRKQREYMKDYRNGIRRRDRKAKEEVK